MAPPLLEKTKTSRLKAVTPKLTALFLPMQYKAIHCNSQQIDLQKR